MIFQIWAYLIGLKLEWHINLAKNGLNARSRSFGKDWVRHNTRISESAWIGIDGIGPIFLQTIPIPVQAQKIWAWTGIIFEFVFQDHLKANFLCSQQPMIVC